MAAFPPDLERELRQSVRQARMVSFTCAFVAPAMYIISLGSQVLRGRWRLFLASFADLPWDENLLRVSLAAACLTLALALILPPRLGRPRDPRAALGALKLRNLLTAALMAAVAIFGLYLGVKIGPPVASLSLVICLLPMVGGWAVLPSESRWRYFMADAGRPLSR